MKTTFRSEEDKFEDNLQRMIGLALCPLLVLLRNLSPLTHNLAEDVHMSRAETWRSEHYGPRSIQSFCRNFYWHINALNHVFHLFHLIAAIHQVLYHNKCLVVQVVDQEELINYPCESHVITHKKTTPEEIEKERLRREECVLHLSQKKKQREKTVPKPPVQKKRKTKKDILKEKKK